MLPTTSTSVPLFPLFMVSLYWKKNSHQKEEMQKNLKNKMVITTPEQCSNTEYIYIDCFYLWFGLTFSYPCVTTTHMYPMAKTNAAQYNSSARRLQRSAFVKTDSTVRSFWRLHFVVQLNCIALYRGVSITLSTNTSLYTPILGTPTYRCTQ